MRCGYCKLRFSALTHLDDALQEKQEKKAPAIRPPPKAKPPRPPGTQRRAKKKRASGSVAVVQEYESQLARIAAPSLQVATGYRMVWVAGVVLLGLFLAIHSIWHYRNQLYVRYPDILPVVQRLCTHAPCNAIRQQSLQQVEFIHRDVRFHPVYEDTLLVNAAIHNTSNAYIPLPLLEFQLYDISGTGLAWRRFAPQEYLGGDAGREEEGMSPGESVYIVLELSGDVAAASGFEFGFVYPQDLVFFVR